MRLIEARIPLVEVNVLSEYEMAFLKRIPKDARLKLVSLLGIDNLKGRNLPKIHNMMYYPARLPLSATRAVVLASMLDSSVEHEDFLKAIGLDSLRELVRKSGTLVALFMVNPELNLVSKLLGCDPKDYVVVDPMAGGGSIPLEAKRMGFTVIAGDSNPVSYLLLRATIEFPAKYGEKLYYLVNEEARRLVEHVRRELSEYYPEEGRDYLIVPSVKHTCGATIPLIRETALYKGGRSLYAVWVKDETEKRVVFKVSNSPREVF